MEHVSIKLDAGIARQIKRALGEFHYTTKTEFIRDAIRAKLKELDGERRKTKAERALLAAYGSLKGQGKAQTDEEWLALKHKAGEEVIAHYEKKFGLNLK